MFSKKKTVVVEEVPLIPPEPIDPTDINVALGRAEREEYKAVAERIGLTTSRIDVEELRAFLKEENIPIYNVGKVDAFLRETVTRINEEEYTKKSGSYYKVHWYPLLPKDVLEGTQLYQYDKAVPLAVLLTVDKIKNRFDDKVSFYVSDYAVEDPDPFLSVVIAGRKFYIAHWDEPGFKG